MDTGKILALDPGSTTGFALYNKGYTTPYQMDLMYYPHPHEVLYDHLSEVKPTTIVYEAFHFRAGQTGVVLRGVEFIGVAELWAQVHNVEIQKFNPEKKFWDRAKLTALELYKPGLDHGMDATRVLCCWLTKNDKVWYDWSITKLRETLRLV